MAVLRTAAIIRRYLESLGAAVPRAVKADGAVSVVPFLRPAREAVSVAKNTSISVARGTGGRARVVDRAPESGWAKGREWEAGGKAAGGWRERAKRSRRHVGADSAGGGSINYLTPAGLRGRARGARKSPSKRVTLHLATSRRCSRLEETNAALVPAALPLRDARAVSATAPAIPSPSRVAYVALLSAEPLSASRPGAFELCVHFRVVATQADVP